MSIRGFSPYFTKEILPGMCLTMPIRGGIITSELIVLLLLKKRVSVDNKLTLAIGIVYLTIGTGHKESAYL